MAIEKFESDFLNAIISCTENHLIRDELIHLLMIVKKNYRSKKKNNYDRESCEELASKMLNLIQNLENITQDDLSDLSKMADKYIICNTTAKIFASILGALLGMIAGTIVGFLVGGLAGSIIGGATGAIAVGSISSLSCTMWCKSNHPLKKIIAEVDARIDFPPTQ